MHKFQINRGRELELINSWKEDKDQKSLLALLELYKPLINKHAIRASRYYRMETGDCQQIATIAFIKTINTFDPSLGSFLGTYAIHNLNSALATEAKKDKTFKEPTDARSKKIKAYLKAEMAKHPEYDLHLNEIFKGVAEKSGATFAQVEEFYLRTTSTVSINTPVKGFQDLLVEDVIEGPTSETADIDAPWISETLSDFIDSLSERERTVINGRYGLVHPERKSLLELSQALGITVEGVRQTELRAIGKIRKKIEGSAQISEALSLHLRMS